MKGLSGLTYEERLQALKLPSLGKRRLRNQLSQIHKILYNHIDLNATHLFKFSRKPGLRRSSIRLLHQTGRTHRRRNIFACRVVNNWNRLPFPAASVTEQRKFKQILDSYVYSHIILFILFSPTYGLFGHIIPSRSVNTYVHTPDNFCFPLLPIPDQLMWLLSWPFLPLINN